MIGNTCLAQQPDGLSNAASQPETDAPKPPELPMARGRVFVDIDGDKRFGDSDQPFVGVKVSNGKEIATTGEDGKYELPVQDGSIIFVIKPTGFRSPMDQNNLPQFYYIHKPDGSPKLKYAGSQPTGRLPASIDFPMYRTSEPETFRIVLFGDCLLYTSDAADE